MMIDIFAGMLSGSAYGQKLKSFHELDGATGVGACFIAVDVARFLDPEIFAGKIASYTEEIKGLRRQEGVAEILLPGEVEEKREQENRLRGVDIPDAVVTSLDETLAKLGSSLRMASEKAPRK
jgi:LDH2 family malate/lactate/ureidoglycolate dehydrogenase